MLNKEFVSTYIIEEDPKTYEECVKSIDDVFWKEAINIKLDSILSNHTWVLTDLPRGPKPLGCKCLPKKTLKVDANIDKYEPRLVAKGFNQRK